MSYFGIPLRNGVGIGLGNAIAVNTSPIKGGPTLVLDFLNGTLDSRITFTRSTTATYTDSTGAIATAAINAPRFTYDSVTLAPQGLLIEEQRTNIVLNSAILVLQTVTTTAVPYTLSFYGTGTVVLSGTYSATVVGTGAYPTRTTLTFTPTVGALLLTITGTVQNAQLEAGAFATSYIPTTIAQVTRTADNASMTGTNFSSWYNASEGTLYANGLTCNGTSTSNLMIVSIGASVPNNQISMYRTSSNSLSQLISSAGAVSSNLSAGITASSNTNYKFATCAKVNDFAFCVNANTVFSDVSGAMPVSPTQMIIGGWTGGGSQWNSTISQITYYPRRLSNTELRVITA